MLCETVGYRYPCIVRLHVDYPSGTRQHAEHSSAVPLLPCCSLETSMLWMLELRMVLIVLFAELQKCTAGGADETAVVVLVILHHVAKSVLCGWGYCTVVRSSEVSATTSELGNRGTCGTAVLLSGMHLSSGCLGQEVHKRNHRPPPSAYRPPPTIIIV